MQAYTWQKRENTVLYETAIITNWMKPATLGCTWASCHDPLTATVFCWPRSSKGPTNCSRSKKITCRNSKRIRF